MTDRDYTCSCSVCREQRKRDAERDELAALRARVAEAEDALLDIFHDYEDDEIGSQPASTQYAFELGRQIFKRDAGNKEGSRE